MRNFVVNILFLFGFLSVNAAGPSATLPILHIDIEGNQEVVSKETYLNATYWLDPMGDPDITAIGSVYEPLPMKIKGRGNFSFIGFDKKPYRLKLDKKAPLMGLKSSKHFGLLAHADDSKAFLRNTIGFRVSELLGLPWTPKQRPVEVVVNGSYRGLYFLTELIRIDSDRVNITKWQEEDAAGNPLDKWVEGGTIVEIDNYDEPAQIHFDNPGAGDRLRFTYDKSVDPGYEPDGYLDWLRQSLGKINDLILTGDRNSDELWSMVDIDDLARFILVQELTDNFESFHGSCYLYRDLGENEKWHFSPVWDFGSAFQRIHPNHSFYLQASGNPHYNHWVGELLEYPALRERIRYYWEGLKPQLPELYSFAEDFIVGITSAAASDLQRWPDYGNDRLTDKLIEVKGCLNSARTFIDREYAGVEPEKDFYITGSFNGWANPGLMFTRTGRGYEYYCTSAIEGNWKINDGTWVVNFGCGGKLNYDETYELVKDGPNISTTIPAGATVIFVYDPAGTSTLRIERINHASIAGTSANSDPEVKVCDGMLMVTSPVNGSIRVADISGRMMTFDIHQGVTKISLPRGIYIVNNRKYRL